MVNTNIILGLIQSDARLQLAHPLIALPHTDYWGTFIPIITTQFVTWSILGFLLIGLIVMDWQTHTLPDAFTLTGGLIGFVLVFVQAAFLAPGEGDIHFDPRRNLRLSSPGSFVAKGDVFMTGPEHLVLGRLLAILCAAGLLLFIRWAYKQLRGREGLGIGDAKLLGMIAAFLGFWPAMLALFVGVVMCSVYALAQLTRRKATAATRLPLGSFLSIGGLVAALVGAPLIAWYSSLL
jgi:leader peptidase (prepilin peptidase)/N-methyltransferase